jgi:triacylglycerol lipase
MRFGTALLGFLLVTIPSSHATEGVILLHGLARTEKSMRDMADALRCAGYTVLNVDYPSRSATVTDLSESVISQALANPTLAGVQRIHFVTHSMGGILVRSYLTRHEIKNLGRVVMLGPPNQGSEVVDHLGDLAIFSAINGPAGRELGTGADSLPNRLGPVGFELGVIAGDRSINWINSLMIDGPDDGKVSVARTRVEGMKEHLVLHVTHPYLMENEQVIAQALHFLREGRFARN